MRAVIFDLDGVLIDSEALQYQAYSLVLERFGVQVSRDEYAEHWIAAGRGPEYAVQRYGLNLTPGALRALKQPVYHDILQRDVRLMPGAREALLRLRPHFALGLATNSGQTDVDYVLHRFELQPLLAAVITRENYAEAKPEPDAYRAAAAALHVAGRDCVVIEDAHRGVIAAHRAGAAALAVPNEFTRQSDFSLAARVLRSLDEVTVELVSSVLDEAAAKS